MRVNLLATGMVPDCIILAEFVEVPTSISVEIGNEPAVFRCCHLSLNAIIGWRVNNLSFRQFPSISRGSVNENGTSVETLIIPARLEYNGTEVECVAFSGGSQAVMTEPAILTLIGR